MLGAAVAALDAPRPNPQLLARAAITAPPRRPVVDGDWSIEIASEIAKSASRSLAKVAEKPSTTNHIRPNPVGAFILPSVGRIPGLPPSNPTTPTMARQPAIWPIRFTAADFHELC